jgi:subtilisin family serine protease
VIVSLRRRLDADALASSRSARRAQRLRVASTSTAITRLARFHGATVVRRFRLIPAVALEVTPSALRALRGSPAVASIAEDIPEPPLLDVSVPLVQGDQMVQGGWDGHGQIVAVLDTGAQVSHPMISGKTVDEACFAAGNNPPTSSGDCPNGTTSQSGAGAGAACTYATACGHGTHVAGIAVGRSVVAPGPRTISGVAPGASLVPVQVFSRFTGGSCGSAPSPCPLSWTSDQIKGLEYVYNHQSYGASSVAAVNMSLGGGQFSSTCDATEAARKAAIDLLRAAGIAVVIAAGNSSYTGALGAPACISSAVSVGSTTKSDQVSSFSNNASFLTLLAPGGDLTSVGNILSAFPTDSYSALAGTSMAAPHVAGAWADLRQRFPTATVATIVQALQATGLSIPDQRVAPTHNPRPRIRIALAASYLANPNPGLEIKKVGTGSGTVVSTPGAINCGVNCKAPFPFAAVVSLTGTPDPGSTFGGWSGGGCSGIGPCQVTLTADTTVTATFYPAMSSTTLSIKAPASVKKGKKAKITGSLASGSAPCIRKQQVTLNKNGTRIIGKTKKNGTYKFAFKVTMNTTVNASFAGTPTCGASSSVTKNIRAT